MRIGLSTKNEGIDKKKDLICKLVLFLQYIIEEVWVFVRQPIECHAAFRASRHLDLF